MNLLLLLSAMLSALTGASMGARAPQVPVSVGQVATAASATRVAAAAAAGRPAPATPSLVKVATVAQPEAWRLAAPAPIYLSRRRE